MDNPNTKRQQNVPWKIQDVIFAYMLVFSISLIFMGSMFIFKLNEDNALYSSIFQLSLSLISFLVVYFSITKKYKSSFSECLGIKLKNIPDNLSIGIFVAIVIVIATTALSYGAELVSRGGSYDPYMDNSLEQLRIISLLAVFIAPIVEEVFFRGFMQPAMTKVFGVFGGILLTALIFAFSHMQYLDYSFALVSVTMIGFILGVARYFTGSIMPGVFAHFFNNLFAIMNFVM